MLSIKLTLRANSSCDKIKTSRKKISFILSILYYLDHYKEAQFININQDNSVNKKITVEKNGVKNQPLQPIEGQINQKNRILLK